VTDESGATKERTFALLQRKMVSTIRWLGGKSMLLWLQTHASQDGFWIIIAVVAVTVVGAGLIFRRKSPPE
jgi:hypothetical protein